MILEMLIPESRRMPRCCRSYAAIRAWRELGFTVWRGFALGMVLVIPSLGGAVAIGRTFFRRAEIVPLALVLFGVGCVGVQAALVALNFGRVRRNIRRSLNAMRYPTCVRCGYDLTGNCSGACPECGSGHDSV
jgi:hypothetical protein